MPGAAEVEACRSELLGLKEEVRNVVSNYNSVANQRVQEQKKLARIVQSVQERSTDVVLIEDIIVVSLLSEEAARRSHQRELPDQPFIDPDNQPHGRTSSAEEAISIYQSQIETLSKDKLYREALLECEADMLEIYGKGVLDIHNTVTEYADDPELVQLVESIGGIDKPEEQEE